MAFHSHAKNALLFLEKCAANPSFDARKMKPIVTDPYIVGVGMHFANPAWEMVERDAAALGLNTVDLFKRCTASSGT
jgi:hypothetical protein